MKHPTLPFSALACSLGFIACLLSASATAEDTLSKIRRSKTFTIAYMQVAPFSYQDKNQQVVGYSIDLCRKIAAAVKQKLKLNDLSIQFLPVDSGGRFSKVIGSQADIECGATTNTAERRSRVSFTIPHFFSGVRMIARASSGIKNWSDLKNRTIAITQNSTTIDLVDARSNVRSLNIKVVEGRDPNAAFALVEQGKADAFAVDDVLLYSLRAASARPQDFVITGEPLSVEPYSLMFRKDDTEFKNLVDLEMIRMIASGEFEKIYNDWFLRAIDDQHPNMKMPMSFLLRDSLRFPSDKTAD
ncbi:MAG: amino acid ABC transporter substrate-binding protein [Burkholderiales bacterium]|nr:amino acid ABC transporter substrate-binding protein [Burkholderiales bacterium]